MFRQIRKGPRTLLPKFIASFTEANTPQHQRDSCILCHFQRNVSIFRQRRLKKTSVKWETKNNTVFEYAGKNITKNDRCYVWGYAATGALGNKYFLQPKNTKQLPRKVQVYPHHLKVFGDQDLDIVNVACGYGFTVFVAKSKNKQNLLYGTGINTDSQIGFHNVTNRKPLEFLITPLKIEIPLAEPQITRYTHVACGRAHTVVVTDKEGVFSLGNNAHGQCCRPIIEDEIYGGSQVIHKVRFDKPVKQVVCGQDNTLILTTEGEVYSCGLGADGQTGLGHFEAIGKLTKVKGDIDGIKIVQVSCKADCVLAVSDEGEVFGWGNSEYSQLDYVAVGSTQICSPVHLPFAKMVGKVEKVAAAGSACALVNEEGDVYVWGYGILGKGPNIFGSPIPSKIPETIFGRSPVNTNVKVEDIDAGMNFFLAKTNYGDLYSWGRNKTAACGLGHKNDQFFPIKVHVPADVKSMYCGVDHVVAKCKTFT